MDVAVADNDSVIIDADTNVQGRLLRQGRK